MAIFTEPHLLNSPRWKNKRIGILGGSFNPPHAGHIHISKLALDSLKLDAIWWLVTPQNPLKSSDETRPIEERTQLCREITSHPKIIVTTIEQQIDEPHSYGIIKKLKTHFPHTKFAWITGMDNAHNLHKWNNWRDILNEICMIHVTRHPPVDLVKQCPARMMGNQRHITLDHGKRVKLESNTTYWLLQKKMVNISSTEIRKKNNSKTTT